MATLGPWINDLNQVSVALSNIQKCSSVVHNHCRRYTYKKISKKVKNRRLNSAAPPEESGDVM